MKKHILILLFLGLGLMVKGQTPYTQNLFAYDSLINVFYGSAVDYAGNSDSLLLDIYKPVGDANCLRPVIVLAHGGAWVAGSKADYNMVYLSRQLAKKGWVVANINYRLGTHKVANYNMYAFCNTSLSAPCGYISDSAEIYRANFRGMQDAKGAIRFMKNRNGIDSTDINNVFIAGESAGGFISLAAAFTDKSSEKHISCFAYANAPTPSSNLNSYGCIPSSNNLFRPDLGSIDGALHTGAYDATVKGVGSFYGGVLNLNVFQQTDSIPCVYMFAQGSDVVVNYNYGRLLGRTSGECYAPTNICQPYYFYPYAFGNEGIRQHFITLGSSVPAYTADILNNIQTRLQNMLALFANKIAASGNNPQTNCTLNTTNDIYNKNGLALFPNPASNQINIEVRANLSGAAYQIIDALGKTVIQGKLNAKNSTVHLGNIPNGVYVFSLGENVKRTFVVTKD